MTNPNPARGWLKSHHLHQPRTFYTTADLGSGLRGFAHCAELAWLAAILDRGTTELALLALGYVMPNGIGAQLATHGALELALGRDHSTICDALQSPLLRRFRPIRTVRSLTGGRFSTAFGKGGAELHRVNTVGVMYLSNRGRAFIRRLTDDPGLGHLWRAAVGFLRRVLSKSLRVVARRCASHPCDPTPKALERSDRALLDGGAPCAAGPAPPPSATASGSEGRGLDLAALPIPPALLALATLDRFREDLAACVAANVRTADAWRPEAWRRAGPGERLWLVRKFEPLRQVLQLVPVRGRAAAGAREDLRSDDPWFAGAEIHQLRPVSNAEIDRFRRSLRA